MEFVGEGLKHLNMADRFTIANMAIEAGGKNGIFEVDEITKQYLDEHCSLPYNVVKADKDAEYFQTYVIDFWHLKPTLTCAHSHCKIS